MFFGVLVIIFASWIFDLFVWINGISVHWYWNLYLGVIAYYMWDISKPDIRVCFSRRSVEGSGEGARWVFRLIASNDYFALSKIYFKFLVQDLFCWLLTRMYHIYCISVHWSWNLFLNVLENFERAVLKTYIWICVPHRFVEGCGEGAGFYELTCRHKYIDWLQDSSSS